MNVIKVIPLCCEDAAVTLTAESQYNIILMLYTQEPQSVCFDHLQITQVKPSLLSLGTMDYARVWLKPRVTQL